MIGEIVVYLGGTGALIGLGNLLSYLDMKKYLINEAIEEKYPFDYPMSLFLLRPGEKLAKKRFKDGMYDEIIEKYKILGEEYEIPLRKKVNEYLINRLKR